MSMKNMESKKKNNTLQLQKSERSSFGILSGPAKAFEDDGDTSKARILIIKL